MKKSKMMAGALRNLGWDELWEGYFAANVADETLYAKISGNMAHGNVVDYSNSRNVWVETSKLLSPQTVKAFMDAVK